MSEITEIYALVLADKKGHESVPGVNVNGVTMPVFLSNNGDSGGYDAAVSMMNRLRDQLEGNPDVGDFYIKTFKLARRSA